MKRFFIAIILMFSSQVATAITYTLKITEDELQDKVSAMMPLEKTRFFVNVILSNPEVDLLDGSNKISVLSNIKVLAPAGLKGSGKAKITGSLTYDPELTAFFFKNPTIENISIDNFPEKHIPKVKSIAQSVASKILTTQPVYKLKDNNLKHKLAKSILQSVTVINEELLVKLSAF